MYGWWGPRAQRAAVREFLLAGLAEAQPSATGGGGSTEGKRPIEGHDNGEKHACAVRRAVVKPAWVVLSGATAAAVASGREAGGSVMRSEHASGPGGMRRERAQGRRSGWEKKIQERRLLCGGGSTG